MKKKTVAIMLAGVFFLLGLTCCGKPKAEKVPECDIPMQTVTMQSQGGVISLQFDSPEGWTSASPEEYAVYLVNEKDYQKGTHRYFGEEELPYGLIIENYYYAEGNIASEVSDEVKAAYRALFQGQPESYRAYLNENIAENIFHEMIRAYEQANGEADMQELQDLYSSLTTQADGQAQPQTKNCLTSFSCTYYDGDHGKIAEIQYAFAYEGKTYRGVYCIREDIPYQVRGGYDETLEFSSGDAALAVANSLEIMAEKS